MSNKRKPQPVQTSADRIVLAYVHPGQVSSYFTQSLVGTLLYDRATSKRIVGVLNEWSSANISTSRNKLVETFLEEHAAADWLLFIDADMAWDVHAPEQLLAAADAAEVPIIGGLCFGSSNGQLFPTIYAMGEDADGQPVTMRLNDFPEDTIIGVAATGAAFLMIHRSALEGVRDKAYNEVFPWFQETALGKYPVGEDITFCLRAATAGYRVAVHTGVHIGHHKTHVLTREIFRGQQKEATAE